MAILTHRRYWMAAFCGTMLVVLAACTATSTVATGTGTPGSTPPAGSTPTAAAASCTALLPGGGAASAGPSFGDVHFPGGAVSTGLTVVHSGTGLYTISTFQACAEGTSAAAVKSFYTTDLATGGWGIDPTLPFDGAYAQPCGDPYCWEKGPNPVARRLIGLESVTDRGNNVVTFQLRVFVPPPAGNCNPADMSSGITNGTGGPDTSMQYPPVTTYSFLGGAAGTRPSFVCSAGDPTSIAAFMKRTVPDGGWQVLSSTATTVSAQKPTSPPSGYCYTLFIQTGTHGSYTGEWDFKTTIPGATCV